ncbi:MULTISPECIES: hybrid sensor histidine kinase/response regulator [Gordonibacter]|uniref:histidine kinase n=1 Tax=Gordonibacter faecis TaxID=3047475 RepID=A0ABT7DPG5_9ACTN|nr:ATP-binding protein [Gordonibacter sp. KGMB12511]MDJ1651444.1 response regulator [Gordonibacter sp. KGMB12511]HIW76036.1 response regulator [Candidatus Gordonibacter avicola]
MTPKTPRTGVRPLVYLAMCAVAVVVLAGGYLLYQQSITQAVNGTTLSFMEQIADHDAQGIHNQMTSKWDYLDSVSERIRLARKGEVADLSYQLSVEVRSSSFERIYLVTDQEHLYDNTYLASTLNDVEWADTYRAADDRFVIRYTLEEREKWGEYLVYGVKLDTPVVCDGERIESVVGLVPVADIEAGMRFESFDGQGVALVIRNTGEIVTASRYYGGSDGQDFFAELKDASFVSGSLAESRAAIERGENVFAEYRMGDERYYVTMVPIADSRWYLVVKVNASVTSHQVNELMTRSLLFFGLLGLLIAGVLFTVFRSVRDARVARESEKAKSTFLANMSHEIRTPLNGLVGLQYLMRQNVDDKEKLSGYLDQADVSADYLKSVITDVLDMSKIESGQMELYAQSFDLAAMLDDIDTLIGLQAKPRNLQFSVVYGELPARRVVGDEMRIKQVIVNLLGNALKFTPEGGRVSLNVSQVVAGEGTVARTTFVVSDTGCGMSPSFLERIWEPFEQEKRAASRNGTGLGASLSKILVEEMGGTIEVESEQGCGSTFTVTVPLQMAADQSTADAVGAAADDVTLEGKCVLVAEDNGVNRMIIVDILKDEGCVVTAASDGAEALEAFAASEEGTYDVVLMDLQMPRMDGYQATDAIRALKRTDSAAVPILALTANAFRDDVDRALSAGMNDVVTKPLDVGLLLDKLRAIGSEGKGGTR